MSDKLADYDATAAIFCVHDNGKVIVTINRDGTLEYGPEYKPDEAAKVFWREMLNQNAVVALSLENDRLRAENEKLRAALKPFAECDPTYFSSAWFTDDQLRAAAVALKETGDE